MYEITNVTVNLRGFMKFTTKLNSWNQIPHNFLPKKPQEDENNEEEIIQKKR